MNRRLAASLLLVLPAVTAACTDDAPVTRDAPRLVTAAGPHVVVAASMETEQPSLGCGGGGDPLLGPSILFVSDDAGAHYDRVVPEDTRPLVRIGVKDGVFYGIAQGADNAAFAVVTSADGRAWTELVRRDGMATDLSLTADGIAVAYNQGVLISHDGIAWSEVPAPQGLYLPSVTQVGGKLLLVSPEDNVLRTWNGTAWDRRSLSNMSSLWELVPAANGVFVSGTGTIGGEVTEAHARVDLATNAAPTYGRGSTVHPVLAPIGLLDTSGRVARIEGDSISDFAPFVAPFESAAVDGSTVQLLRTGTISISTDGGATFGAPSPLPTLAR